MNGMRMLGRWKFAVLTLVLAVAAIQAPASTVNGKLKDCQGVSYTPTRYVRFVPLDTPLEDTADDSTILDAPRNAPVSNGVFQVVLMGGRYLTDFGPANKTIRILVPPDDTNAYSFNYCADLATNLGVFVWTNSPGAGGPAIGVKAGSYALATTNGSVVTISGTGMATDLEGPSVFDTLSQRGGEFNVDSGGNVTANSLNVGAGSINAFGIISFDAGAIVSDGNGILTAAAVHSLNFVGDYFGAGIYLSNLNASVLVSGTVPDAALAGANPVFTTVTATSGMILQGKSSFSTNYICPATMSQQVFCCNGTNQVLTLPYCASSNAWIALTFTSTNASGSFSVTNASGTQTVGNGSSLAKTNSGAGVFSLVNDGRAWWLK